MSTVKSLNIKGWLPWSGRGNWYTLSEGNALGNTVTVGFTAPRAVLGGSQNKQVSSCYCRYCCCGNGSPSPRPGEKAAIQGHLPHRGLG